MNSAADYSSGKEVITESLEDTLRLASDFARSLQQGSVILLSGEMGTGKTQFVKGVVEGLGGNCDDVDSPTFSIINEYKANLPVYHMDCYRLESEGEASVIGIETYLEGSGVCLIEWPERINGLLPLSATWIRLFHESEHQRRFIFY